MESLGRMAAIILAVVLMFLFPLRYDACNTYLSEDSYTRVCLDHFFNDLMEQKELTKQLYDDFLYQISLSGEGFKVQIDCYHKVVDDQGEYLIYEDGGYQCCKQGTFQVKSGDYISIQLVRRNIPLAQKLMNWLLPTFYMKNTYTTGGYVI